jgi:hypothetical protein
VLVLTYETPGIEISVRKPSKFQYAIPKLLRKSNTFLAKFQVKIFKIPTDFSPRNLPEICTKKIFSTRIVARFLLDNSVRNLAEFYQKTARNLKEFSDKFRSRNRSEK